MILNLLSQKNFITFNKTVAKTIGLEEALVLGQICSLSNMFRDKEFYFTYAEIQEETCLSEYSVKKAVQNLIKLNILTMKRKGCPCKNWYKINEAVILEILENRIYSSCPPENEGTRPPENEGTRPPENEGTFIKDINTKDINTKDINSLGKPEKEKSAVTIVFEAYQKRHKKLYEQGKLQTDKIKVNYGKNGKLINSLLKDFTVGDIIMILDRAMTDTFCLNNGYALSPILSDSVFSRLLNAKTISTEHQETKEQYTDEEYMRSANFVEGVY